MARADLGSLLGKLDEKTPPTPPPPEPEPVTAPAVEVVPAAEAAVRVARPAPRTKAPAPVVDDSREDGPTYLRFVRKETRLRDEQQNQLTLHARRLNRTKAPGTPRITDNTLIRIAVDLLLDRIDHATGDDETALLASLRKSPR